MIISRRAFLAHAAFLAGAAAAPAGLAAPPAPGLPAPPSAPEFGYTFDDYLYQTGFPSRAAAAASAAFERPGESFRTAEVAAHALRLPDELGECAADWLANGGRLGNAMADWLVCANEEGDFEGEFGDACFLADRSGMGDAGRAAIGEALDRAGAADLAAVVRRDGCPRREGGETDDAVYEAVASDARLADALAAAIAAWAAKSDLGRDLRGLSTFAIEAHPATAPEPEPLAA